MVFRSKIERLEESEKGILESFDIDYDQKFVDIPFQNSKMNTISVAGGRQLQNPIVLIHGFGAGLALWGVAIKPLTTLQDVHAFDLLGFAKSSRPRFSHDFRIAEQEMVESIEMWRNEMKLERINIVAHSFGGYLATCYSIKYPNRIDKLVLVDPWGFNEKLDTEDAPSPLPIRGWMMKLYDKCNPLLILRIIGFFNTKLIERIRPDLRETYSESVYEYVYLCNAREPTGEKAFKSLTNQMNWAKNPMIHRFDNLPQTIQVTFIHGSKSWIDYKSTSSLFDLEHVEQHVIEGAGHHVYADNTLEFNEIVIRALSVRS